MLRARHFAAVLAVSALTLAGCSGGEGATTGAATSAPATTAAPTTTAATTAAPTPEPTSEAPTTPARPDAVVEGGTVAEQAPVTASGTGPAVVTLAKNGDFNVVAAIDCPTCTGPVVLTGPDRGTPFAEGTGPYQAQVMTDVFMGDTDQPELWVIADAGWTLDLRSWNDLTPSTGVVEGSGPAVLYVKDSTPGVDVHCAPVGGEQCMIRAFSAVRTTDDGGSASVLMGSDEETTHAVDLEMPGIVTIRTNGAWKLTPR